MEDNETISDNLTGTTSATDTCYGRVRSADWQNAALIVSFVVLGLINIMVIVGNTLVILAVFIHSKLRTVTNLFIVSLALSDLLVGVAVLPFSTTYEVLDVWFFGDIWCQMWLAVDVWMCTASILNLCAISLDRYLAVSRPVSYPSIMSSKRAKVLIAVVWCVSFIICLPPLVGWNDSRNRGPGAPANAANFIAPSLAPHQQTFTLPFDSDDFGDRASSTVVDKRSVAVGTRSSQIFPQLDSNNDLRSSVERDEGDDGDSKSAQGLWATLLLPDPPGANRIPWDYPDSWNDSSQDGYQSSNSTGTIRTDWDMDGDDVPSIGSGGSRGPSVFVSSSPGVEGSGSSVGVRGVGLHTAAVNATATCVCQLINDKGYRIYSSLGSFYLPMLVMMFFYWRIYRAAVETTRAINQGFRTTKSGSSIGGRFDEQRLTLRIHRGKSTSDLYSKANGATTYEVGHSSFRCSGGRGFGQTARGGARQATAHLHQNNNHRRHQKTADVVNRIDNIPAALNPNARSERRRAHRHNPGSSRSSAVPSLTNKPRKTRKSRWMLASVKSPGTDLGNDGSLIGAAEVTDHLMSHRDAIVMTTSVAISGHKSPPTVNAHEPVAEVDNRCGEPQTTTTAGAQLFSKMGKRNIKAQVKRFKMETKAAKTLGIIVGGFILCWLPFFTIYLIGAFCEADCIPDSLFSVFFWLGYCNSAINPCVYALFSRDFRHAFKKILCRCALRDDHNVKERIVTMFPAMHLTSFFEESEEGSNSH